MIETRVARIISSTQVVLAAGSDDGVKEGMLFAIYSVGDEVLDPETGQSLGRLELVKGKVRVAHVQEKMSVAETQSRQITKKVEGLSTAIIPFGPREVTVSKRDELTVDESSPIDIDMVVRVGDNARNLP